MNLIIGAHVSFKNDLQLLGCVKDAIMYGANTFMFYTGAPQNTNRKDIDINLVKEAKEMMDNNNIDINNVIVHAPYIVNLANPNNFDFSVSFLKQELNRCNILGIKYIVLHPGSAVGVSREEAINNIAKGLNLILDNNNDVSILLETMAGKGNEIGINFPELKSIIDKVDYKDKIGICLDTCHISDAGYDINNFDKILDEFDNIIGLDRLKCLHINDSKNPISSHKDRHENIGLGYIGFNNILNIVYNNRIINIPKILETPFVDNGKEKIAPYKFEIEMLKEKKYNDNLINDIIDFYK